MILKDIAEKENTSLAVILSCLQKCPPVDCSRCPLKEYDCDKMIENEDKLFYSFAKNKEATVEDFVYSLINMTVTKKILK